MTLDELIEKSLGIEDKGKLAYSVGAIMGDGGVYEYKKENVRGCELEFSVVDKEFAVEVARCLTEGLGFDWNEDDLSDNYIKIYTKTFKDERMNDQWRIIKGLGGYSDLLDNLVNNYSAQELMDYFEGHEDMLAKGLFDAEGSIGRDKSIQFAVSTDREMEVFIRCIQKTMDISLPDTHLYEDDSGMIRLGIQGIYYEQFMSQIGTSVERKRV